MTRLLAIASLTLLLAGCSGDPTAKQFEKFAEAYAEHVSGEKAGKLGHPVTVKAELLSHNLRKTDSLTVPFLGEAVYRLTVEGYTIWNYQLPNHSAPASFENKLAVNFSWTGSEWQHNGGTVSITDVQPVGVDAEAVAEMYLFKPGNASEVTAAESEIGDVCVINGMVMTADHFYENSPSLRP